MSSEVLPQPVLELPGAARAAARELDCRPATEPVDHDMVMMAAQLEVIGGNMLEGIVRRLQRLWRSTWL